MSQTHHTQTQLSQTHPSQTPYTHTTDTNTPIQTQPSQTHPTHPVMKGVEGGHTPSLAFRHPGRMSTPRKDVDTQEGCHKPMFGVWSRGGVMGGRDCSDSDGVSGVAMCGGQWCLCRGVSNLHTYRAHTAFTPPPPHTHTHIHTLPHTLQTYWHTGVGSSRVSPFHKTALNNPRLCKQTARAIL